MLVRRFNTYYANRPGMDTSAIRMKWLGLTGCSSYHYDHQRRKLLRCYTLVSSPNKSLHIQVLGGIADTVAQSLTAIRQNAVRKPGGPSPKDDFFAIEIHELDRKIPFMEEDLIPDSKRLPPPFDFERLTRFMAYGFIMAPVQHRWFGFLSRTFPISKTSGLLPAMKRVAFDQLLFAPVGMSTIHHDEHWRK